MRRSVIAICRLLIEFEREIVPCVQRIFEATQYRGIAFSIFMASGYSRTSSGRTSRALSWMLAGLFVTKLSLLLTCHWLRWMSIQKVNDILELTFGLFSNEKQGEEFGKTRPMFVQERNALKTPKATTGHQGSFSWMLILVSSSNFGSTLSVKRNWAKSRKFFSSCHSTVGTDTRTENRQTGSKNWRMKKPTTSLTCDIAFICRTALEKMVRSTLSLFTFAFLKLKKICKEVKLSFKIWRCLQNYFLAKFKKWAKIALRKMGGTQFGNFSNTFRVNLLFSPD